MRAKAELAFILAFSLEAGLIAGQALRPPQSAVAEFLPPLPKSYEEYDLKTFFAEADRLKTEPNLFAGRRFRVTTDQMVFLVRAVDQPGLKTDDNQDLVTYVFQGQVTQGEVGWLDIVATSDVIGDEPLSYPPHRDPEVPRSYPAGSTFEFEGKMVNGVSHMSPDRDPQPKIPVLAGGKILPPIQKQIFANSNSNLTFHKNDHII